MIACLDAARHVAGNDRNFHPSSPAALEAVDALDLSDPRLRALPIRTLASLLATSPLRIIGAR